MSRRPPLTFIFTITLTGILNNSLVTPAIPDILAEFGVPDQRAGMLVAAGSVAGIVVAPLIGFLADRFGRRLVLTTCLGLFGAFGGVAAIAPSFTILLWSRVLQGVGSAGLINLAVVLIGDHWDGADRTRLVGRNSAILTVGLASLPLLSGIVTEAAGWRVTFAIYTVALLMAVVTLVVLDESRPTNPPSIREQLGGAGGVIRQPEVAVTFVIAFVVFIIIFGLLLTVFPLHLEQRFGMSAGIRGIMISVPAVTSSLAAFNLGRIRAHLSPRTIVIAGSVIFISAFLILGSSGLVILTVLGALLYGCSEGMFIPTIQDLAMATAPNEHRGAVVAVWVGAARLGQTTGPLLAGLALSAWSPGTTLMVGSGLAGLILLVGLFGPISRSTTPAAPRRSR